MVRAPGRRDVGPVILAVGKTPSPEQRTLALEHLAKHEKAKKVAYENILWALLNSKAFLFNQ